jgi:hypothetical protein
VCVCVCACVPGTYRGSGWPSGKSDGGWRRRPFFDCVFLISCLFFHVFVLLRFCPFFSRKIDGALRAPSVFSPRCARYPNRIRCTAPHCVRVLQALVPSAKGSLPRRSKPSPCAAPVHVRACVRARVHSAPRAPTNRCQGGPLGSQPEQRHSPPLPRRASGLEGGPPSPSSRNCNFCYSY